MGTEVAFATSTLALPPHPAPSSQLPLPTGSEIPRPNLLSLGACQEHQQKTGDVVAFVKTMPLSKQSCLC